jgi:hypothetical protein
MIEFLGEVAIIGLLVGVMAVKSPTVLGFLLAFLVFDVILTWNGLQIGGTILGGCLIAHTCTNIGITLFWGIIVGGIAIASGVRLAKVWDQRQ